ncbi:hypothetical protein TWF694_007768 [Orbilia ellipsospora]|uniref:Uncharacterized protein n=1 Tax=Orbilia ellipsospora TaxID=2528407 RepID=A0AAV9XJ58_9PEZI
MSKAHQYKFVNKDYTLILDAPDPTDSGNHYLITPDLAFDTPICYIYAENVILAGDLHLPGKTLGIFCNTLTVPAPVPPSKTPIITTIDVSGKDGTRNLSDEDVRNGGDGGVVYLYVENMTEPLLNSLRIKSNAGNGAVGMDSLTGEGGPGGNGGDGGNIQVAFGSIFCDIGLQVYNGVSKAWAVQVKNMSEDILPAIKLETIGDDKVFGYLATSVASWDAIVADYDTYSKALQALITSLGTILSPPESSTSIPDDTTVDLVNYLISYIESYLSMQSAPRSVPKSTTDISAIENAITAFIKLGSAPHQQTLVASMKALSILGGGQGPSKTTDFGSAIDEIMQASVDILEQLEDYISQTMGETKKGYKGLGGRSNPNESRPTGKAGLDGKPGYTKGKYLGFDGRDSDSDVPFAYAFPEQCRMLLNIADSYYFVQDSDNWATAAGLYHRLSKRLSFMDNISKDSAVAKAYQLMDAGNDNINGITFNPLLEIRSVYVTAQSRLNQISLCHDMFGNADTWVPRLSAQYYKGMLDKMMDQLKLIETAVTTYEEAEQDDAVKSAQAQVGFRNSKNASDTAQDHIDILEGLLTTYEKQISTYASLIAPAHDKILANLETVASDIRNAININPEDIINAITNLAMCPNKFMAIATIGSEIYKAETTVTNAEGVDVNKNYVLQQLTTCGDTLKSLHEAFKQNSDDGTLDLDDPGASMILAQQNDITKLLQDFSNAIPKSDSSALADNFKDYANLVSKRNNAVMSYNSTLQLLAQAIDDRGKYAAQTAQWGETLLKLPTDLPAIVLWLKRCRDNLQLGIMQRLNYQSRAIYFWGLNPVSIMNTPGPLGNSFDLSNDQGNIDSKAEEVLQTLANNTMKYFPASGGSGAFYQISDYDLATLTEKPVVTEDGTKVWTNTVTIKPKKIQEISLDRNIRLTEVRFWLLGVKSNARQDPHERQVFNLELTQCGTETIQNTLGTEIVFTHDPVTTTFGYYCNKVTKFKNCVESNKWDDSSKSFQGDWDYNKSNYPSDGDISAPIGPYSDWTITIKSNEDGNPGLDLSNVTEGWFEFIGRKQGSESTPSPMFRRRKILHE